MEKKLTKRYELTNNCNIKNYIDYNTENNFNKIKEPSLFHNSNNIKYNTFYYIFIENEQNSKISNYQMRSYLDKGKLCPTIPLFKNNTNNYILTERKNKEKSLKKISTKQMKIKLIKFINSRKNNSFEKTILLSKENNESKKYIRKIDIDLKNLIISKKRKIKSRVGGISGDNNFKIKSQNLINNAKFGDNNLIYNKLSSYSESKKILNNDSNKNRNTQKKFIDRNTNVELKKLRSKTIKTKYLRTSLNNIARNITYINQKNNTISNKKVINLLKREKYTFNKSLKAINYKKNKMNSKSKTIKEYDSKNNDNQNTEIETNKDSLSDYSYSSRKNKLLNYKLRATIGDLNYNIAEFNNLDNLELNKAQKLKFLIKNFLAKQSNISLKNFDINEYNYYINAKVDTNIKEILKLKNNKKNAVNENNKINNIPKNYFSNNIEENYNDSKISAKSLPEVLNLDYENKVLRIFDKDYAPKKIMNKNKKILHIIYLNLEGDEIVPCYENGEKIRNENILLQIYLIQKQNKEKNLNKSQIIDNNNCSSNNNSNNKYNLNNYNGNNIKYINRSKKYNDKSIKYNNINEINERREKNGEKRSNKMLFRYSNTDFPSLYFNNTKNFNYNTNDKLKNAPLNKNSDLEKIIKKEKIDDNKKKIQFKKSNKRLNNKEINKKNDIKEDINFEMEEENKELNEILKSEDEDEEDFFNNNKTEKNKNESFEKEIDKALLYLVLFLKEKNIKIESKDILYKLLKNKNFKKGIDYFKSKINKNKEHAKNIGILPPSSQLKDVTEETIINYLYKKFMDNKTPYYKVLSNTEDYIQNSNWKNISQYKNYKNIFMLLENEAKKEKKRKLKILQEYNQQVISEIKKEEMRKEEEKKKKSRKKIEKKKIEKKGKIKAKGLSLDIFKDDYEDDEDKKKVALNELSLTNELKYHIKMANDDDSKERFKYLLNQIQQMKTYDIKEYISSIKDDFNHYKGEIKDLVQVKDMEERINSFVYNLSLQREKNIIRRNNMENKFSIKDGIFQSSIMNIEDNKINNFNNIKFKKSKNKMDKANKINA